MPLITSVNSLLFNMLCPHLHLLHKRQHVHCVNLHPRVKRKNEFLIDLREKHHCRPAWHVLLEVLGSRDMKEWQRTESRVISTGGAQDVGQVHIRPCLLIHGSLTCRILGVCAQARTRRLRIHLLWFGLKKWSLMLTSKLCVFSSSKLQFNC